MTAPHRIVLCVALATAAMILATPRRAHGYSLAGGFTESCHEVLTLETFAALLSVADASNVPLPQSDHWRAAARELVLSIAADRDISPSGTEPSRSFTEQELFVLYSAAVGVRVPDTEGHSTTNLAALRQIHGDPASEGQYAHALRGPSDDGVAGDVAAIEGTKDTIRRLFREIRDARGTSTHAEIIRAPIYLDHYGRIELEVLREPYLLGRALHALQDSFAHTIRSADGRTVLHVLNYVEAIAGTLDERRDGMAHSDALDDCTRPVGPLLDGARLVSAGATAALGAYVDGDASFLEAGLSPCEEDEPMVLCGWLTYNPQCERSLAQGGEDGCCTIDDDYCGSPWVSIAREEPTQPYLKSIFGCAVTRGVTRPATPLTPALLSLSLLAFVAWRRRVCAATACLGVATPTPADADEVPRHGTDTTATRSATRPFLPAEERHRFFLGVEAHAAAASDVPGASIIDPTVGYGLRFGFRFPRSSWGQWGLVGHAELDHWVTTEFDTGVDPGAFNGALGPEVVYGNGYVRSSLVAGTSTLVFDAAFHDAGTTGLFVELRPIGLRFRVLDALAVTFDPLSFAVVAPAIGDGPTIEKHEYRMAVGIEWLVGRRNSHWLPHEDRLGQ